MRSTIFSLVNLHHWQIGAKTIYQDNKSQFKSTLLPLFYISEQGTVY